MAVCRDIKYIVKHISKPVDAIAARTRKIIFRTENSDPVSQYPRTTAPRPLLHSWTENLYKADSFILTVRKIDFSIKYSFGSELIQNAYPALYAKPLCNASTMSFRRKSISIPIPILTPIHKSETLRPNSCIFSNSVFFIRYKRNLCSISKERS